MHSRARYVTELIGTYFLILTIGLSTELGPLAPVAVASVLAAVIYAGGHISLAHYNPAITLAFWRRGRFDRSDIEPYITAQLIAAVLASGTVGLLSDATFRMGTFDLGPMLLAEFLFTFALAWVILNVATADGTAGNEFYGVAIAAVVAAGIYAVGPVSGAVFNPAVAIALSILGLLKWSALAFYVAAQVAGALFAAWVVNQKLDPPPLSEG